jgi:hypothetical protein
MTWESAEIRISAVRPDVDVLSRVVGVLTAASLRYGG